MSALVRPQFTTIDGLSVRFAEGGQGDQDAILLSPWPESVYAFEPSWEQLAAHAHLVAVDPPGFGKSDYRESLMNPKAMGDFIIRIADTFGLDNPHVVGPDIGTSSSLFAAAAQPGRFRTIVVGSGGAAVPIQVTGVLKDWVEATDLEPYRQFGGRNIVEIALSTLRDTARRPRSARTICPATRVTASPTRSRTPRATANTCPNSPSCSPRSRHRFASSPGPTTRWCRRSTPSSSGSTFRTVVST